MPKVVEMTDENGDVVAGRDYDAFGQVLAETGDWSHLAFGFHPNWVQLKDVEGGRYYVTPGGRIYDTELGRFLQRDPIRLPTENTYVALRNNPQNVVDPWGWDGKKATGSLPPWPARLPLEAPQVAPPEFRAGVSFRVGENIYEPKSEEELRDMWPRIALERAELERKKAQEVLKTRKRVTYVNCSKDEEENVRQTLRMLQEKLRAADPKKCRHPCCRLDFRTVMDVLGKLQIECAEELEHDVRPNGEAYGKQKGPTAYGIALLKSAARWRDRRALAALILHETLHTAMFQFQDPHTRYGKDPTAKEMHQCIMNCISLRRRGR